jgi:hypothetical protein
LRLSILLAIGFATALAVVAPEDLLGDESWDDSGQAMVTKFLDASKTQQETLRGGQMQVKIAATLPRLAKQGEMQALRSISKLGKITYQGLGFSGDNTIKNQVISRFIAEESQPHDTAITPANYKFKHKATTVIDGRQTEVFQLTPVRKAEGLFKGELWLDAQTGMPVREAGRLVKSSIFLKKVEFVNSFEIRDGVSLPKHFQSTVQTRLVGRAELSIDYSNFSKPDDAEGGTSGFREIRFAH